MTGSRLVAVVMMACVAGCASGYSDVGSGQVDLQDLELQVSDGWNRVPSNRIPWARRGMQVWTRNGMSLDRLVLIPRVPDGESIYLRRNDVDYPAFQSTMTTAEQLELVAETIELAQGANVTEVDTRNSRVHRFGSAEGVLFDLNAVVHDGPEYRGAAGAFVNEGRLYLVYFLGATPYYYEQSVASAMATIESASL